MSAGKEVGRVTATFQPYYWEAYNEIVEPRRFDHYLVRRWLPDLGQTGFTIVKILRDRCYHDPRTGVLRNTCEMSMDELATAVGVSRAFLFKVFKENTSLAHFVRRIEQYQLVDGKPRRDRNVYQVSMDDPVHPADLERYDELRAIKEVERQQQPIRRLWKGGGEGTSYESTTKTHSTEPAPYESTTKTADTKYPPSTTKTAETSSLESTTQTAYVNSPSGGSLPSDSLTPSAGEAPPINSPQGEDGHGSAVEGEGSHSEAVTAEDVAGELRDSLLCAAWTEALKALAAVVDRPTFEAHLKPLRPLALDEETGQVELLCASRFAREWLDKRYREAIEEALGTALGRPVAVRLVTPAGEGTTP